MAKKKTEDVSNAQILQAILGLTTAIQGMGQATAKATPVVEQKKRGRPAKKQNIAKVPKRKKQASGKEIFSNPRPNLFEQMEEFDACKEEVEQDKAAWGDKTPTPRRPPVSKIKIKCTGCGKTQEVSPVLVSDEDQFKCNSCQAGKGR